jgi:hypothetical protein
MRTFLVIMDDKLGDEMPEMLLAEDTEMIEQLDSQGLCEPLRKRVPQRRRMHLAPTLGMELFG